MANDEDAGADYAGGMTERDPESARKLMGTTTAEKPEVAQKAPQAAQLAVADDEDFSSDNSNQSNMSMAEAGKTKKADPETVIQEAVNNTNMPIKVTWTDAKFTVTVQDPT